MKKFAACSFAVMFLFACTNKEVVLDPDTGSVQERWETTMVDNVKIKHGKYEAYFPDGQVSRSASFDHGHLDGVAMTYYANGSLATEQTFEMGIASGSYKAYDETGDVSVEGNFLNGLKAGEWKHYDKDGKKVVDYVVHATDSTGGLVGMWKSESSIITFRDDYTVEIHDTASEVKSKLTYFVNTKIPFETPVLVYQFPGTDIGYLYRFLQLDQDSYVVAEMSYPSVGSPYERTHTKSSRRFKAKRVQSLSE